MVTADQPPTPFRQVPGTGGGGPVVQLTDIAKSFGETKALRRASFTAHAGEIHAIVGENGSGKSTLAKIMSGVLLPDAGSVTINGHHATTPAGAAAAGISTVFQEVLVAEGASIVDNVFIGRNGLIRFAGSRREQLAQAGEILGTLIGRTIDASDLVDSLSLADRQWVTIARALIREPKVVIFDESTAALDLPGAARLYAEMQRLRSKGVCVIVVTHRIAELTTFADRATVLRDGVDVGVLTDREITEDRLIELMTGVAGDEPALGSRTARKVNGSTHGVAPLLRAIEVTVTPGAASSAFSLDPGQIVGFAGLDGQGQTEFLQILTGVRKASSGSVTATGRNGEPKTIDSRSAAIDAAVAYISGDRRKEGIFPNLSIAENFAMPLYQAHTNRGFIDRSGIGKKFLEMSDRLKLRAGAPTNSITSLSGGNQQKVLIGRELAQQPNVVALNDPARGVDISTKRELYAQLNELAENGAGIIYLSSEIDELVGLCDRVAVFRDGALFGWLDGDQISSDRVLAAMFGHLEANYHLDEAMAEEGTKADVL